MCKDTHKFMYLCITTNLKQSKNVKKHARTDYF